MSDINQVMDDYFDLFGEVPHPPFGVSDQQFIKQLSEAISTGKQLDENVDWYADLPPDAKA